MDLKEARKKIDETDSKIIELVVKRFNLVKEVAEYKKANNLPIRDLNREKEVLQSWKDKFRALGLEDETFVECLFKATRDEAVKLEKQDGVKD